MFWITLLKKYGEDVLNNGGLRVITSLNYDLQSMGEKIANDYALENKKKFEAENAAIVATDPKNRRNIDNGWFQKLF